VGVSVGETGRAESAIMATKKKRKKAARKAMAKKPTKRAPKKSAKRSVASRKPTQTKKTRVTPPKKTPAAPAAPPPKTFAEKVRDRDAGTEVWYRVGDVVTRGTIRGDGAAGNVSVLSNGVVSEVPAGDLYETRAAAQAAR
jgi:sRNA-binding protein